MTSLSSPFSFTFEVRETLSRCVTVEADCFEDAFHDVRRQYKTSDIILDAGDFLEYDILFLE